MNAMGNLRRSGRGPGQDAAGWTPSRIRFWLFVGFLVLCALTGGASRPEEGALAVLRPGAVAFGAAFLLVPGDFDLRRVKLPLMLLTAFTVTILVQLIPLPPGMWAAMPGHAPYAEMTAAAGVADVWRPISMTPDLTWNSLVSLLPAYAALIGLAGLDRERREMLALPIICLALASAALGTLQLSSNGNRAFYLYTITHAASAVGFFANRNHEAAMLVMCFPMLRLVSGRAAETPAAARRNLWLCGVAGIFLACMLLITGSRAGMFLGLLSLAFTFVMAPIDVRSMGISPRAARIGIWAVPLAGVTLAALFLAFGRAESIQRLFLLQDLSSEGRVFNTPTSLQILRDFLPFGTGQGAFDSIFRAYEPDSALRPSYFNHAHNDLLELALTGGVLALLVLAAFLIWYARAAIKAFRPWRTPNRDALVRRAGAICIGLLLAASLVDYPLRTGMLSVLLMVAASWLAAPTGVRTKSRDKHA